MTAPLPTIAPWSMTPSVSRRTRKHCYLVSFENGHRLGIYAVNPDEAKSIARGLGRVYRVQYVKTIFEPEPAD